MTAKIIAAVKNSGIAASLVLAALTCFFTLESRGEPARLNNFVVELAEVDISRMGARGRFEAEMDMEGWIYILLEGEGDIRVRMTAGGEREEVLDGAGEAMRHVPAGPVRLDVTRGRGASPERLTVRRVAETKFYHFVGYAPRQEPWTQVSIWHSWEDLDKALLHSANVLVSRPGEIYEEYGKRWQERGGKAIRRQTIRPLRDEDVDPSEFFSELVGGKVWDGAILDELLPRDNLHYERYADGLERFSRSPEGRGKSIYWWIYSLGRRGQTASRRILEAVSPAIAKSFRLTEDTYVRGGRSLRLVPDPGGAVRTRQLAISMEPGREYTLSAYMRTGEAVHANKTGLFIIDQGWQNEYGHLQPVEGDSEWRRYEATFVPDESRNELYQLVLTVPEEGSIWIDALQLERGDKAGEFTTDERNKIRNPDFSAGLHRWMAGAGESLPLIDASVRYGHVFSQEMYLLSEETEEKAAERIDLPLEILANAFEVYDGPLQRHVLISPLLYDVKPGAYCGNFSPQADYKVFLDMQMHAMANREGLEDLRGVGLWAGHYARKETLAWYGELLRHYCIEGNTERLSDDPYILPHLRDPGFAEGLREWDTRGNVEAVKVKDMPEGAYVDERNPQSVPSGDTIIRTVRGEGDAANSFGQKIRDLEPGRLYFLKVFSTDPEYSDRLIQADISIQGGEIRPEGERTATFSEEKWNHVWRARRRPEETFWTMHFRVFRAAEEEGYLEISDVEPGEVYWDFIQIAPFFEK